MNDRLLARKKSNNRLARLEILQATVLLNLESALLEERYEDCPGLIEKAKEIGVNQDEVRELLVEYTRKARKGRRIEVN